MLTQNTTHTPFSANSKDNWMLIIHVETICVNYLQAIGIARNSLCKLKTKFMIDQIESVDPQKTIMHTFRHKTWEQLTEWFDHSQLHYMCHLL